MAGQSQAAGMSLLAAGRRPLGATGGAVHRISVDVSGVLTAARGERDLAAVELAVDRRHHGAILKSAGDVLKALFDRQIALPRFPSAVYFCRDDPQVSGAPVGAIFDRGVFVGLPIFHIKSVRDDPSAGF